MNTINSYFKAVFVICCLVIKLCSIPKFAILLFAFHKTEKKLSINLIKCTSFLVVSNHGFWKNILVYPLFLKINLFLRIPSAYFEMLQWNLSNADTIGKMKLCPLYRSVRFIEITFNRVSLEKYKIGPKYLSAL